MADWIEKTVFGCAFALILGCQSRAEEPYCPPHQPARYAAAGTASDTAALLAEKQREADEAVREMLKVYEQEDFDFVRGDAEAYK